MKKTNKITYSEHCETYCGYPIRLVETFGDMTVYLQKEYSYLRCPKYVVFKGDKAVGEFRTKKEAFNSTKGV